MKTILRLTVVIVLFFMEVTAQNNKNSIKEISSKQDSYILADLSYMNDAIFMGRRDSIAAPYIFPSIGYYDASGFFADISASYLTASSEQRIDLFLLSTGYLFDSKKWSGGISVTGYFFNEDSYNVQSEMTANLSGLISYDLKTVEISLSVNSFFNTSSRADIFGELVLSKILYLDKQRFLIKPSFSLGAGTQNFYEAYYKTSRLGNRKGKGSGGQNQTISNTIEINEATEFNLLNIELGMPFQYYHESFIFSFSPTLAFPQSSATITTEDLIIKEKLESVFYWSVGISYWFSTKKNKNTLINKSR
ncbi:hypothetical protein [Ascidiimonas sp. W6]|uniref:hypothetical protein n=1 Tax=Ascidiimonas meishanensis TaxID=3128903 RepID=UPI0030EE37FC